MPAEIVSCSWTRDPTKTAFHSVQIRTQALPLWARISLISWYVPIKIANATQFVVRWVAWSSKTDRHEHFKSATIKTKKVSQNYIISF